MTALLQHLVLATILAALVALGVWLLRANGPAFRYRLWLAAALSFALPTLYFHQLGTRLSHAKSAGALTHALPRFPEVATLSTMTMHLSNPLSFSDRAALALGLVWLLGTLCCFSHWLRQPRVHHHGATSPSLQSLRDLVNALTARLGVRRPVLLQCSTQVQTFALAGVLHPVILVPAAESEQLTPAELEAVLVHELAHLQRRDNLYAVIVHTLVCFFWFHPGLRWIERRLSVEREQACDEAVLEYGCSPASYASGILKLCGCQPIDVQPGTCAFSGGSLPSRLDLIFAYSPGARRSSSKLPIAALYVCLTLTPVLLGFLRSQPLQAANHPQSSATTKPVTCVFADRTYPEGAIIREGTGGEQMCVEAFSKPLWVRTSPAVRQQNQAIIALPQPAPVLCKPQRSHSKVTCACEGGAEFSPGSNVDSPDGPLSCSAGKWVRRTASVP